MTSRIFVATRAFVCSVDGKNYVVDAGDTVREGHPLLSKNRDYFVPQRVKFEYLPPPVKKAAPSSPKK